jgi:hypothetical protein
MKYFQQHGWEKAWIDTAEGIVQEEFKKYDIPREAVWSCMSFCGSPAGIINNKAAG